MPDGSFVECARSTPREASKVVSSIGTAVGELSPQPTASAAAISIVSGRNRIGRVGQEVKGRIEIRWVALAGAPLLTIPTDGHTLALDRRAPQSVDDAIGDLVRHLDE